MRRTPMVLALLLAAAGWPARAGEEEFDVNFQTGRRAMEPDPLLLPQWRTEDRAAFAAGHPVNLGGGLWSDERYPIEPPGAGLPLRDSQGPDTTATDDANFVRAVDLRALAQGPSPVASAASPEAAELLRAAPRPKTPRWPWLLAPVLVLGAPAAWGTRRRHLRSRLFQFPETEPPARLGGPHSGGSGAVLRW